jgi:hypothetical protein
MNMRSTHLSRVIPFLISAFFFVGCNETFDRHYESINDATRDGAIQRGWIPAILLPDAKDIRETHDLDSNRGSGSFALNDSLVRRLKSECASSQALPPTTHAAHWWRSPTSNGKQAAGEQTFQCGGSFVAADPSNRIGYFWTNGQSRRP